MSHVSHVLRRPKTTSYEREQSLYAYAAISARTASTVGALSEAEDAEPRQSIPDNRLYELSFTAISAHGAD